MEYEQKNKKGEKKFPSDSDFDLYMKLGMFKELRAVVSKIMKDHTSKEEGDDW